MEELEFNLVPEFDILKPLIKWTGSKRYQVKTIQSYLPLPINTYYEPFVGGANVVGNLYTNAQHVVCGDVLEPVIAFYNKFQTDPQAVIKHYTDNWTLIQADKEHFYVVRERFNKDRDPLDFFFLSRTSHNGLVRFNSKGLYNASYHHTSDGRKSGINPQNLIDIANRWHSRLFNVYFVCNSFEKTIEHAKAGDFIYCDPPYEGVAPVYGQNNFKIFDLCDVLLEMTKRGVRWMCSYNYPGAPTLETISTRRVEVPSGQSSFRKLNSAGNIDVVEMLYLNY